MKKILFFASLLNIYLVSAQVSVTNFGNLQVYSGASLTDFSNFTNGSSGKLVNNGNLYVKGDITNNEPSMSSGSGSLFLNGSSTQTIGGTEILRTYNLTTNNAAGVTLNNDLCVKGMHTFSAGIITTSAAPNYLIYAAGAMYMGSSDNRHVNGWVKKIGATNFNFPVGNGVYLRPIALTNLTASAEFNVHYYRAVTPNRFSLYNPLVLVDSAEYWTINKISGAAANVAMNWDNGKVSFPNLMISDIRASYYDGTFWRNIGGTASGSALTTGNITSNSVSAFNANFTLGSVAYVLPLKIITFTASRMDEYTKLNWTIANEMQVDHYELQRSDDGTNFYTIYTHAPFNRNGTEFYGYDDRNILKGTAFYRLKVNDPGARIIYSKIVSVSANDSYKVFYVITNPVNTSIDIFANTAVAGTYNYTITSTSGQLMQSGILEIKYAGTHSIHLNSIFASGAYILTVQNEKNRLQKTIIKK